MTNLKNANRERNIKNPLATKLNSNYDIKVKNLNSDKTQNSDCDRTPNLNCDNSNINKTRN